MAKGTKGVIRSRRLKNTHTDEKEKNIKTNNGQQNIKQKTKD